MIFDITPAHIDEITAICNHYIRTSTATFELEEVSPAQMRSRIEAITANGLPAIAVADTPGGKIQGYAYVHPWKERAAYSPTLEATVYLAPGETGRGIGRVITSELIERTRALGCYKSVIACITADNAPSIALVRSLGFTQVSLFRAVGSKFGRTLDVVDYQLML